MGFGFLSKFNGGIEIFGGLGVVLGGDLLGSEHPKGPAEGQVAFLQFLGQMDIGVGGFQAEFEVFGGDVFDPILIPSRPGERGQVVGCAPHVNASAGTNGDPEE